eukprot:SM000164S02256  [mRNA]  locus=s164:161088:164099:+ [translate_table: standard]
MLAARLPCGGGGGGAAAAAAAGPRTAVAQLGSNARQGLEAAAAAGTSAALAPLARRRRRAAAAPPRARRGDGGVSFGDRLLDYIEGGPKLRKWYGAPDRLLRDGGEQNEGNNADEEEDLDLSEGGDDRTAVLVCDADSETGQLVVLALILQRERIRALVKSAKAAESAFGPYVEAVEGTVDDPASVDKGLRGTRAVICPAKVGVSRKAGRGLFAGLSLRQHEADEEAVLKADLPVTIIRAGRLQDEPGGQRGLRLGQGDELRGSISREDAANLCVKALDFTPQQSLIFEAVNSEEGSGDWPELFGSLKESTVPATSPT